MVSLSRKDGVISAIAVAILVIGTATGSAIAMFVASVIALCMIPIFYREQFRGVAVVAATAAAVAIAAGVLMSAY